MIYSRLRGTSFEYVHDSKGFKFFTFSDIFPIGDLEQGKSKYLIISSPWEEFINILHDSFEDSREIRINNMEFNLGMIKKFSLKVTGKFITGSPIVLYRDNLKNEYFSFRRHGDFNFFITRLRDNAIKKYTSYYNHKINLNEPIFNRLVFKKEVVVQESKSNKRFIIIGSVWKLLEKRHIPEELERFYNFIADCGLGEKNSLGFGFINPIRK